MLVNITVTRYFIDGNETEVEWTPSWLAVPEKVNDAVKTAMEAPIPDLPDMVGNPWREMTDDEVRDYIKRKEDEQRENRRAHAYDEDDE